eukprot:543907_1
MEPITQKEVNITYAITIPTLEQYSTLSKETILNEILTIWCYKCQLFLHQTLSYNHSKVKHNYDCIVKSYKRSNKLTPKNNKLMHKHTVNTQQKMHHILQTEVEQMYEKY